MTEQRTIPILRDEDVERHLTMREAVEIMTEAFRLHGRGKLTGPARPVVDVGNGQLVFTCGGVSDEQPSVGFRVYDLGQIGSPERDEVVAVFDATNGALKGLTVGPLLGAMRTGAIGGAAVDALARRDAKCLGIIGTGYQARTQLTAALSVRAFERILVFSRSAENRSGFAAEMTKKTGRPIEATTSVEPIVESADVLICATNSAEPVVDPSRLKTGVHINHIGPKFTDAQELPLTIADACDFLVTDTLAQAEDFGARFILAGTPHYAQLVELSAIVAKSHPGRQSPEDKTLFYSLGLAATEVILADRLLEKTRIV